MENDPLAPLVELPGVLEAVDASRAAVDSLLKERILRSRRADVRARALTAAASALAALDEGDDPAVPTRVLAEVPSLTSVWGRAPLQALARLHSVAAVDRVAPDRLGRPRADAEVAARLTTLADVLTRTQAPGVVLSAVVHGELLALAPFEAANGLVARVAGRLVLMQRGVDPDSLTVPEEGMVGLGLDAYREAAVGFASGTPEGLAHWITLVAASVQRGAGLGRRICAELAD
jgi:hypothetical protein